MLPLVVAVPLCFSPLFLEPFKSDDHHQRADNVCWSRSPLFGATPCLFSKEGIQGHSARCPSWHEEGISVLDIVLHYLFRLPTGLLIFALNVPLLIVGYIFLGGARFTVRTLVAVAIFSITVDPLGVLIHPLTHDAFLAGLYGGVIS